jgi:hypothetical protein
MRYYILSQGIENEEEDSILEGWSKYLDRIRISFDTGEIAPLDDILIPIEITIIEYSLRGRMTDLMHIDEVDCFVITNKAIQFFQQRGITNFQTLPIVIIDPYSNADAVEEAEMKDKKLDYVEKKYENYAIFNVVNLIDCINHEASQLEYFATPPDIPEDMPDDMKAALQQEEDNDIDFIRKLVLDDDKIPQDIKIFRLKDCPRILVFKEEIVNAIKEAKLTGFVFVPLDKYTDEIPDNDREEEAETVTEKVTKTPAKAAPEPPKTGKGIVIKGIKNN